MNMPEPTPLEQGPRGTEVVPEREGAVRSSEIQAPEVDPEAAVRDLAEGKATSDAIGALIRDFVARQRSMGMIAEQGMREEPIQEDDGTGDTYGQMEPQADIFGQPVIGGETAAQLSEEAEARELTSFLQMAVDAFGGSPEQKSKAMEFGGGEIPREPTPSMAVAQKVDEAVSKEQAKTEQARAQAEALKGNMRGAAAGRHEAEQTQQNAAMQGPA